MATSDEGSGEDRLIATYFRPIATHPGALGLASEGMVVSWKVRHFCGDFQVGRGQRPRPSALGSMLVPEGESPTLRTRGR